jgi:hypothetical protein
MDHPMEIDDEDFEPTPLALPHQIIHRVVSHNPEDMMMKPNSNKNKKDRRGSSVVPTTPKIPTNDDSPMAIVAMENLISDSDGAGDYEDEDEDEDDFHSATSHDEFPMKPRPLDVIFGRGQPLRDHPGNMRMRDIIKRYTSPYRAANKQEKTKIIKQIQQAIAGNGARFLMPYNTQEPSEGCKPATAAEIRGKISHGLRDAIKVEDLLDSEFVQLWASDSSVPQQQQQPLQQQQQQLTLSSMASPDISPLSFRPMSSNPGSPPPSLSLGPPPPLMMMPPQHSLPNMNVNMHAMNTMNMDPMQQQISQQQYAASYSPHHQRALSFLSQSGRSSTGPAIFHVSVPQGGANMASCFDNKDNTMNDDLTLETAEKGLSSNSGGTFSNTNTTTPRPSTPQSAIAVNAVLHHDDGSSSGSTFWSKHYRTVLSMALTIIVVLAVLLAMSSGNSGGNNSSSSNNEFDRPTSAPTLRNGTMTGSQMSTLEEIRAKGYLTCGVANQPGYSARNVNTNVVEGFEIDLVRTLLSTTTMIRRKNANANSIVSLSQPCFSMSFACFLFFCSV